MKATLKLLFIALAVSATFNSCYTSKPSSFIATMEIKDDVPGLCDKEKVLVMFPMLDEQQVEAKCPLSNEEIEKKLNAVDFLKDNDELNDEGMLNIIINCSGRLVKVEMDKKTTSTELDDQIVAEFKKLKTWTPATYYGTKVDNAQLISFEIKEGTLTLK